MIGEDDTRRSVGRVEENLEGIALRLPGGRTDHAKIRLAVVGLRAEHEGRPVPGLLPPLPGIQVDPDEVAAIGNISGHQSMTSAPTSGPKSVSPWSFEGVQPRSS